MIGKTIGTYRLVRELGRGGMGAVYEAVHERIGQRAAVKVLDPALSRQQKQVDRFFDEARAIGMVPHPGLVKLFDFNRLPDGTVYILMEFLEGESLWGRYLRLRKEGRWLSVAEAVRIARQVASALSAVHDKGIIHRDLKPENIFIVSDPEAAGGERAKLLDFGIAKIAESSHGTRRTTVGTTLGTPFYMSPEQCQGADNLTDKSDVYALGVLLFEMLTGRPPFDGDQGSIIMANHIFREPPQLARLPNPPPPEVCTLVAEMLAKDPVRRPSMSQIAARLGALATSGQMPAFEASIVSRVGMALPPQLDAAPTVQSPALSASKTTRRYAVARPLHLLAGGLLILLIVAALVLLLRENRPAPRSPASPAHAQPTMRPGGQPPAQQLDQTTGQTTGPALKDAPVPPAAADPAPSSGEGEGEQEQPGRKRGRGKGKHRLR
jgi:serine/threonine-protein kinase